jgi:hypothetical protein
MNNRYYVIKMEKTLINIRNFLFKKPNTLLFFVKISKNKLKNSHVSDVISTIYIYLKYNSLLKTLMILLNSMRSSIYILFIIHSKLQY